MPNIAIVNVLGDLDVGSVSTLREGVDALIDGGCRRIILNMAEVGFVDSAGMGLLLTELRRMRSLGGLLSLTNVTPRVYRSLAIMRIMDYMPVLREGPKGEVCELSPSELPRWCTTFQVDGENLGAARSRLAELMAGLPLSDDDVFDMTLACGEALGNAIDHTCAQGVLATFSAYGDRIVVDVADCGCGFEALPEDAAPDCDAERGRGIRLMRMLADAVSIKPKQSGLGTVVRLVKLFPADRGDLLPG